MKLFAGTFLLISIAILTFPIFEGAAAQMEEYKLNLPKTIGVWTRSDSSQTIDSTNIFKYMDGAGELYLSYRFDRLEVYEYTADNEEGILVELYYMKTSNDAFGLLSLDWGGEPIPFESPPVRNTSQPITPPNRALYGKGLLRIWSDNIYSRVMAYQESPDSRDAVFSVGKAIVKHSKNSTEPRVLNILPHTISPDWKLRHDRIGYFRSYLVLNSLFYLSHQNILNLDLSTEAVTAPYEKMITEEDVHRVQFLFVKYADSGRARKALDHFHKTYLPEHEKNMVEGSMAEGSYFFKIEDGWLGYRLNGRCIVLVFECPDKASAGMILKQIKFSTIGE